MGPLSYMSRAHKLAPLFRLTFRRSSLQHPLLAGALGKAGGGEGGEGVSPGSMAADKT